MWAFTHQAVIMSFRYVLEGLTEQELLEIDRTTTIENVSVTVYAKDDDGLVLDRFADTGIVGRSDAPVTEEESKTGTEGA